MFKVNDKELSLSQAIIYIRAVKMRSTTKDFVKLTGVSSKTLCDIECGRIKKPHAGTLIKIANACDVEPTGLLDYLS